MINYMENVLNILTQYSTYITIGLIVLVLIQFILLIVAFRSLSKVENKFRKIMRGVNNKNLEELINSYLDKVEEVKKDSEETLETNKIRSEERRVGKECRIGCRSRWSPYH